MRKLFTLLILLFLWAGSSWGQGQVNAYTFVSSSGTYTEITGGTQLGSGTTMDDVSYNANNIGFTFNFNETNFTQFSVNANGFLAFGASVSSSYAALSTGSSNNVIAAFNADLQGNTGATLRYELSGTTPNQVLTIQWKDFRHYAAASESYNFQVKLYETTNVVEVIYGTIVKNSTARTKQVGLRGSSSSVFNNRTTTTDWAATTAGASNSANCTLTSSIFPASGLTFTWTPPAIATPPNCATLVSPADAATNVPVSTSLNWASGGGAPTGYNLYFGADELPEDPIDLGLVTTYDPAGDMDYSTTYYWKVVPYNAFGDATGCPTWTFTTGPDPTVTVFPFTEGFEGAAFPPYGWSQITVSGTSPWIMSTINPHSGLQCARAPWASAGGEHLLITPPLDLNSVDYRLKFWLIGSSLAGTDLEVQIATSNSSASNFSTTLATYIAGTNMPTVWTEQIIDLSAYEDIQYIAFRLIDDDGYAFYIDDVTIEEIPATPVFSVSPLTKDYGSVAVGGSSSQVFTISNTGGGTLVINPAISVTGTDADQFVLTDANSYPLSLTAGQTATVSVAFTPTSEGAKSASLVIVDNLGSKATNTVPLTGTGFVPPPGSTCDNPYPTTLPLVDFSGNTSTMGDDYSSTWITPSSLYMNGDDMVFEFTLTEAGYLDGSMTTTDSYLGLFILEDCPDPVSPAAVIRSATSSGSSVSFADQLMQPGTYFAIVSSWPDPQSIEFILNLSFEPLPDCLPPTGLSASVTSTSANLSWTEAGTATAWEYVYGEAPLAEPTGSGTATTSNTDNPITSLEPGTNYQFYVRANCGDTYSTWTGPASFSTTQIPATLPLTEGFESGFGSWAVVNGTQPNTWFAGTAAVPHSGTNSAFITNDGGTSYSYTIDAASVVHLYRDIAFTGGEAAGYSLKFWYKGLAESCCDYMKVFIVDPSTLPVAGTQLTTGQIGVNYNQQADYVEVTLAIPNTVAGTKRLVFSWRNDGSIGPNPPVSLDDISLQVITTGAVRGEVTDCYTGALLEGVTVSIAGSTTTTDANGYYEFPAIATGTYDLTASLSGYFNKTITGVVVSEGATTTQDLCLNIYVDPPLNLQASVENQDVHLTWNAPGVVPESFTDGFESYTDFSLSFPPWLNTDIDLSSTYSISGVTFTNQGYTGAFITFNPGTTVPALTDAAWLAHSGSKYAACFAAITFPNNDWLISPQVAVVTGSQLKFWAKSVTDAYGLERFRVGISTTGTATTDFTIISAEPYIEAPLDWTEYTFDLSAYVGQNIYVAINCVSSDAFVLMIDDFSIGVPGKNAEPIIANRPSDRQLVNLQPPTRSIVKGSNIISEKANVALIDNATENNRAPMATLTGYNIYKDEAFLAFTTLTEYDDLTLPAGTYSYTVTAVYSEGESEPAGPVTVEIITCNVPTNLQVTEFDQTTATIGWTAPDPAPANGYEYEVRTDGDPGSGATGLAASGTTAAGVTTANITGLEDGTNYMVYVRSVCGTDNYSNWTGGVQFVTTCLERNLPFAEDFEESSANRNCWTIYNIDLAGTSWGLSSSYNHTEGGTLSAAHAYGPATNTEDGYLVSPGLIIPASGYIELSFWSYNSFPSFYDKNSVMISAGSPDPTDGDYVEIWSPASVTASWVQTLLDLSAYQGQTIYIAFRYQGSDAHNWYVDDVSVSVQTPPVKTLNLKAYIQGFWNGSAMNQAQDVDQDENIFNKFSGTTVDTLSVYLAEADAPWAYLFAAHEVNINTDGSMVISVPAAFSGSYYIVIDHHSSVETWSALPVDFSGTTIDYDFTTAAEQAYGSNQKSMGTVWALYSGDVGNDEYIEFLDVVPVYNLSVAGFFGYSLFDLDGSGYIEFLDYIIAYNNSVNGVGMNTPPNPAKRPGLLKLKLTD